MRADILERLNNIEGGDLEDKAKLYFAAKKILWILTKKMPQKPRKFNQFQQIKIAMGKDILGRIFKKTEAKISALKLFLEN